MEPVNYLKILRRRWVPILACLVVALGAAWATTPAHPRSTKPVTSYKASATLLQTAPSGNASSAAGSSGQSLNYVALFVTNGDVPVRAARLLHYSGDPAVLASTVTVTPDTNSGSLTISASGSDGPREAAVVNAFATQAISFFLDQAQSEQRAALVSAQRDADDLAKKVAALNAQLASSPNDVLIKARRDAMVAQYGAAYTQVQQLLTSGTSGAGLSLLQKATPIPVVSGGFVAPSTRAGRLEIGLAIGLLLGVALALVLERLDTRLRTRSAVQGALDMPVVAEVPRASRNQRRGHALACISDPVGPLADGFRNLRSALLLTRGVPLGAASPDGQNVRTAPRGEADAHVVLFTSARSREGKTTTVANVAACLAEAGRSVLVLDCDFRHPDVHHFLDVPLGTGLSNLLLDHDSAAPSAVVRPTSVTGVTVLTAGSSIERPTILPTRMKDVIESSRRLADIVLIDTSPLLQANDALDLMPFVDSVVVLCKSGRATREQGARVSELLRRMRVPVVGAALIAAPPPSVAWAHGLGYARSSSGRRGRAWGRRRASEQLATTSTMADQEP